MVGRGTPHQLHRTQPHTAQEATAATGHTCPIPPAPHTGRSCSRRCMGTVLLRSGGTLHDARAAHVQTSCALDTNAYMLFLRA